MPTISRFYGIEIRIHYRDHGIPHFHARYTGRSASFAMRDLTILEGRLPPRATRLVRAWAREHEVELLSNWYLARKSKPLKPIPPLP